RKRLRPNPRPAASSFRNPGGPSLSTPPPLIAAGRGNSTLVFMVDSRARDLVITATIFRSSDSYPLRLRPRQFFLVPGASHRLTVATQLRFGPVRLSEYASSSQKKVRL